jgi:hypothetical protein
MSDKPPGEERENVVAGGDRWLAGLVDQVLGNYAVGAPNAFGNKRCDVGVGHAVWEHTADEAISECRRVGGEALRSAEPVSREAISQNR